MVKKKVALCMISALLLLLAACGQGTGEDSESEQLTVVATVFPAYDFARAAGGGLVDVQLLLPPGTESHSYEPTPADILAVQDCDLFIYLGGESDTWVETLLESVELRGQTMRMVDCVPLLEEETVEGMESYEEAHGHDHDHEEAPGLGEVVGYDEHVWTSPRNAAAITRAIGARLEELDAAYPQYQFAKHKGYGTKLHYEMLDTYGPCPAHRRSFLKKWEGRRGNA